MHLSFFLLHAVALLHSVGKKTLTLNKHGVVFSYHGVAIGKEMKVRDIAPLGIRIPPEIKEKLKEKAKEEGRSLNSEIVQRLIRSLKS
ncbi:TPA: YlcI/YnfO family protein [Escherichia coli]|nr:YlcI/YnfO family protein [Escherichia coli]MCH6954903.1 hypothetical protein [Escherichia coli]MCN8766302.1 Arc family DNA-binding protein [Escherichia coli]MCV1110735.1 Arc family DNA-binding protein [Escherichia coli]MDA6307005.1 Arc family DNA-binding protein [Escherichia coli]OWD34326.1 hypothetical protein A8C78_24980 [Escherichia coli]